QSFESRNFRLRFQLLDGTLALFIRIAINRFLFIPHTEQWRLKNIKVPFLDQFREELQEERDQQQTDVHSVNIGIGGNYNVVVPQIAEIFLDVQRRLQQVELLVFINNLLAHAVRVQRLSTQTENCLRIHVTRFGNRSRGRISLGNEKRTFQMPRMFRI